LTSDDLPGLIDAGSRIETLSVDTILAAYRWGADTDRFSRMTSFSRTIIDSVQHMRADEPSSIWATASLDAQTPGVAQLPTLAIAQEQIAADLSATQQANEAQSRQIRIEQLKETRVELLSRMNSRANDATSAELDRIVKELDRFLESLDQ